MMKIAIMGNSNCVFKNGFSNGVERFAAAHCGEVRNYSLGGSCCALHIYTYHDRHAELCEADLVILDSLVIDSSHWRKGIIRHDELLSLIDDMYALYARLPGKVVSLLFPLERFAGSNLRRLPTYIAHQRAARKYGIDVVDMFKLFPHGTDDYSVYFMQPGHIRQEIANEIGFRVAANSLAMGEPRRHAGESGSPYRVVKEDVLCGLQNLTVESSYFSASCYRLDRPVGLDAVRGQKLVGVLHWNKSNYSKFVFSTGDNEDVVQFRPKYAFFEVLNSRKTIGEDALIRAGEESDALTQKPAGHTMGAEFGAPQIAGLLVRGEGVLHSRTVGSNVDLAPFVGDVFAETMP